MPSLHIVLLLKLSFMVFWNALSTITVLHKALFFIKEFTSQKKKYGNGSSWMCLHLDPGLPNPANCEEIYFCSLNNPIYGFSLQQPEMIKSVTNFHVRCNIKIKLIFFFMVANWSSTIIGGKNYLFSSPSHSCTELKWHLFISQITVYV